MSDHFGCPGIGGSLGQCAVCGDTFLLQILTGEKIISFHQVGIQQTLYAHKTCQEKAEKVARWEDLPNGPLRQAFEKNGTPTPEGYVKKGAT